jgi:membrane fusion protein, multidrug efflux system
MAKENVNRKSKKFVIALYAFAILSAALLLTGCGKGQNQMSFDRPPAPVQVALAEQKDVPIYIDAIGNTMARELVKVQPQIPGRITELHFKDGADLKKGTLLFTIDPKPFQAKVSEAEANLAQAKAVLGLAKIQFERVQGLIDSKAISKEDYDTKKNAVDVAEANVLQRQAEVETARINLEYCSIRSPIDGRAGKRLVDIGNIVKENETELLTIQRLDPIYADFTVTENDLSEVQRNAQRGTLKTQVMLPDDVEHPRDGDLTFMDNSVTMGTGTVTLRATIPNSDHLFWPGRFVKVRLILSTKRNAVLIAAAAPQQSAKGPFVYVVKPDETAELRPVTIGQQQGNLVVIEQGIKPGEKIVINGQLGVTPGGKVRIEENIADAQNKTGGKS